MKATFTESLLNNTYSDNNSLEEISYREEAELFDNSTEPEYLKQIEVGEDDDYNVLHESVGQVAGGFIDALNEMGTLFNYVGSKFDADISLPDISVAGYDLTQDGRLNTLDAPDSGVGGFIRGLSQFATGFLVPGGLGVKALTAVPKVGGVVSGNNLIKTMVKSGIADFTAFGANDPRLSNMLREYGGLRDPITNWLSAPEGDEELDSELNGRLKNAIEGAGLGFAFEGIFNGLKWTREGLRKTSKAIQEDSLRDVDELIDSNPIEEGMSPQIDSGVKEGVDKPVLFAGLSDDFLDGLGKRDVSFDEYTKGNVDKLDFNINTIEDDDSIRNTIVGVSEAFGDIEILGRVGTGAKETIRNKKTGKTRIGAKTQKLTKKEAEEFVKNLSQNSLGTASFINRTYLETGQLSSKAVAVQILMQKSAKKLYELAEYVSKNEVAPEFRGTNIDHGVTRTQMAYQRQKAIHAGFQSEALGIKSEIGRALNALKIDTKSKSAQDAQVKFFQDQFGGVSTIQKDAERVLRFSNDKDSIRKASKIAKGYEPTLRGKITQGLIQVYINGILSGLDSTLANSAGNLMSVATAIEERFIASGINSAGKVIGKGDGVQFSEALALAHGMKMGIAEGWQGMAYAFAKDAPSNKMWVKQELAQRNVITAENFNVGGAFGSFIDHIGTLTRFPSRLLLSNDEFFRGLSYNMEKHAQAYVFARKSVPDQARFFGSKEGREQFLEQYNKVRNLGPDQLRQYADLEGIDLEAQEATLKSIFAQKQSNKFLQGIDRVRQSAPFGLGQIYIPFYNTILNILKFTGERTPGIQLLFDGTRFSDFRFKNGQRAGQLAMAKTATGVAMYSIAYNFAENGMITGALPENLNQRMNLLEKGTTPYAFVTEDGYVPFNRLDPIGTMFGLAADVHNLVKIYNDPKYLEQGEKEYYNSKLEDVVSQGVYQLIALAEDKAMLRGFSNIVSLLTSDPLKSKEAKKQLFNAYNPIVSFYSALRGDSARAYDQIVRQTGSADFYTDLWNDYYKRNPEALRILGPVSPLNMPGKPKGFSGDLMPRLNYVGEPVKASVYENKGTDKYWHIAQAYLSPVPKRPKQTSPLIKKITELNVQSKPPSRWRSIITRGKFGTDTIPLTAEERYFWSKTAGDLNKKHLEPMLNKPFFKKMQEGQQRRLIESSLRKHKLIAKQQLLRQFPRLTQRIRAFKMDDLQKMQKPASVNQAFLR